MGKTKEISPGQIKKLWASARENGLEEDDLRQLIKNLTGSEKISTMTSDQAVRVIDILTGKTEYRPGFASKEQLWKIKQLATELGWGDNPKRLRGFIKKYAGVENMKWLRERQASNIIEGLKKIQQRQNQKTGENSH
ncbi:MAG: regulatory protein GemA [Peptococcaceae bacterium]|jgi:hypothetical protein|nr:regulatory protein GemA [Peptococcaceae bacterium]MDH7526025.1 regulatory protein GemA [Peptococcaceae bacterium]